VHEESGGPPFATDADLFRHDTYAALLDVWQQAEVVLEELTGLGTFGEKVAHLRHACYLVEQKVKEQE
jgi:hypothetical protein